MPASSDEVLGELQAFLQKTELAPEDRDQLEKIVRLLEKRTRTTSRVTRVSLATQVARLLWEFFTSDSFPV